MNEAEPAPTPDDASADDTASAGHGLQARIADVMHDVCGVSSLSVDWRPAVAREMVDQLLSPEQAALQVSDVRGVRALNLALYRMSYEAALACEHARHFRAQDCCAATRDETSVSAPGDSPNPLENRKERLRLVAATGNDDSDKTAVETIGPLARMLCLGVIDMLEALDRYDYADMQAAHGDCNYFVPSRCTLEPFRVFECLRLIAQAGLSRDTGGAAPGRRELQTLAELVSADRDQGGERYTDYALLLLVIAVGHTPRQALVNDAVNDKRLSEDVDNLSSEDADNGLSIIEWLLDLLQTLERRDMAKARGWPIEGQPNPMAHQVHFYRQFAHHIRAIALAQKLKKTARHRADDAKTPSLEAVKREYSQATAALERALRLVPASNEARWRYYDLSAENLDHESSLRVELLEQQLSTRETVEALAKANVDHFSESAQDELRDRMADVSMRVVEVIGIFLAVVAILGVTVSSATVGGLSLNERILLLSIGGAMPLVYFVLLRWLVTGKLAKQPSMKRKPDQQDEARGANSPRNPTTAGP